MQLTVLEVLNAQRALSNLASKPLPVRTSLRVANLLTKVEVEVKRAETRRVNLVEKYGIPNASDPKEISVQPDKTEAFSKEFTSLLEEKVNLDFTPINVADLGDIEIAPIDMRYLSALFITE